MGITNTIAKLKTYFEAWHTTGENLHLDLVYPVGSIYMSVNDVNPKNLFGGEWEKIEGKFLLGSGKSPENNSIQYTVNNTGGSKDAIVVSHTHTQKKHTHTQDKHSHGALKDYYFVTVKRSDGDAPDLWCPDTYYNLNKIASQTGTLRQLIVAGDDDGFYVAQPNRTNDTVATNKETVATNEYTGESEVNKNMPPYLVVNIWRRIQ